MKVMQVLYKNIPKRSRTPFLTYCRQLIKEGKDPDVRLEAWENGHIRMFTDNIGESAKWTVKEEPRLRFVKFNPPSHLKIGPEQSTGTPKDSLKINSATQLPLNI